MVKPSLNATAKERVKGLAELRDLSLIHIFRSGKAQGKDAGADEKQNSAQTERGKRALI